MESPGRVIDKAEELFAMKLNLSLIPAKWIELSIRQGFFLAFFVPSIICLFIPQYSMTSRCPFGNTVLLVAAVLAFIGWRVGGSLRKFPNDLTKTAKTSTMWVGKT